MLEQLGSWTSKSKVAGSPVEEFHFGSVRVARIVAEYKNMVVKGVEQKYRMFQWRIFLPGVGVKDVSYAWTLADAKSEVEVILDDWLFESGFAALFDGEVWEDEVPATPDPIVTIPESIVVLEGLGKPPASAKILPLESWRRDGKPRPKDDFVPYRVAGSSSSTAITPATTMFTPLPKTNLKSSLPRKSSHSKRRALSRGQ